jgi:hypothetical protein
VDASCVVPDSTFYQGLTLVHFSAQPEPLVVTDATAAVHLSAQAETFVADETPQVAHEKCSWQAEKRTHVVLETCLH